jgi:hypothetical protein
VHLEDLVEGVRAGNALAIRMAVDRLDLMKERHKMAVRGGKRVCGNCSRGHDMKALVIWPCADYMILSGIETQNANPQVEIFRPGID